MMKLHMFPFAPNPAKVRLYLAEKAELGCEIPLEEVTVNLLESEQKGRPSWRRIRSGRSRARARRRNLPL